MAGIEQRAARTEEIMNNDWETWSGYPPDFMVKPCLKVFGAGSAPAYYYNKNTMIVVIEPETGAENAMSRKDFERSYVTYSTDMPKAILERFRALPPYRRWRAGRKRES